MTSEHLLSANLTTREYVFELQKGKINHAKISAFTVFGISTQAQDFIREASWHLLLAWTILPRCWRSHHPVCVSSWTMSSPPLTSPCWHLNMYKNKTHTEWKLYHKDVISRGKWHNLMHYTRLLTYILIYESFFPRDLVTSYSINLELVSQPHDCQTKALILF